MTTLPTVEATAAEFKKVIKSWLTAEELKKVDELNAAGASCASHDFCDANQAMLDALGNLGLTEDEILTDDGFPDDICVLMDAAWKVASDSGFSK